MEHSGTGYVVLCVFIILNSRSDARHATHAACPGWPEPIRAQVFCWENGGSRRKSIKGQRFVNDITQQTRHRGAQCAPALAEQASFAGANDPNAGRMGAVPNLPQANCPPMADRAHTVRPYGRFDLLLPQFDVAFSRSAEESR